MSGIEVAGLVLGALPLIVEALKAYSNGISTIGTYLRYELPLKTLHMDLSVEYTLYQNACERLLEGLVDDNDEREALLQEPGGRAWRNPDLERKLQQRLSKTYSIFNDIMQEIHLAVLKIKELLRFDSDGKIQFNATNGFEKEYQRLKFSLKKSKYDGLVKIIRQRNSSFRELTNQSIELETNRRTRNLPDFELIRSYAASVYTTLCIGLQCNCQTAHVLHLRLKKIKGCHSVADLPSLGVIILYSSNMALHQQPPWTFEPLDIRLNQEVIQTARKKPPHDKRWKEVGSSTIQAGRSSQSLTTPKPVRIMKMCDTLHQLGNSCNESYIGFIEDNLTCRQLHFYQAEAKLPPQNSVKTPLLSLHNILTRQSSGRRRFSRRNGLHSAVLLSSNLLQLYQTPWLNEMWNHDDISFFENSDSTTFGQPFISRTPSHPSNNCLSDSGLCPWDGPIRNRFLFALGILLIELCLDTPFEQLRSKWENAQGDVHQISNSDLRIAHHLLEEVTDEFGPHYSSAVRRCLRCDFDTEKVDLEDMAFSRAVYEGVVLPLEDALKTFNGGGTV